MCPDALKVSFLFGKKVSSEGSSFSITVLACWLAGWHGPVTW